MPTRKKRMLELLAGGALSQSEICAILHCSKRDVSAASAKLKELGFGSDDVADMTDAECAELLKQDSAEGEGAGPKYLQPDADGLVERKKRNRKLPVKMFWYEYCEDAASKELAAYSYQTFCEKFAAAKKAGVAAHFIHDPGAKAYIDWAGDVCHLTDRVTGARTPVYVLIISLPFSAIIWARGYVDMAMRSWIDGHERALAFFGGVPHMLIPDNAGTATDRKGPHFTKINDTYQQFAEHYGTAVVPARVRKPRDKSEAEEVVDLVEKWIVAPSEELVFRDLDGLNEFIAEQADWLNNREFSAKDGSRIQAFEDEEREYLAPLPVEPFEICDWRRAKVPPDYHIRIDWMHYSVPHTLVGETCDAKLTQDKVTVMHGGEVVAVHPRLRGRKNQYSTNAEHMPPNHASLQSPWSPDRFTSWAAKIGPATKIAIERMLAAKPIVEQAFVPCRNVLGLSKQYSPALLERACAKLTSAVSAAPSYTAVKNAILAIKAADARKASSTAIASAPFGEVEDKAPHAGLVSGADAWKRKRDDEDDGDDADGEGAYEGKDGEEDA
jgi:transposase